MRFLADCGIIFRRQMSTLVRSKLSMTAALIQPVLYLVLFGPMLKGVVASSGADPWKVYVPGLLVQLALFGAGYVGFSLIPDLNAGVIERLRVTPISRYALLFGRVARDVVLLGAQAIVLTAMAFLLGLRAPIGGLAVAIGIVVLLAVSLSALSYSLVLALPKAAEHLFAPVANTILLPLMLLSGILLPMSFGPKWLDVVSHIIPFRFAVNAMRDLFDGQYLTAAVGEGLAVAIGLAIFSVVLGGWTFTKENA